jgi:putative phosphoesterase
MSTRLGVISDSHGHVPYTLDAVRMLESLKVNLVVHCGDVGSPAIPPLLSAWRTHYVLGNVDYDEEAIGESIREAGHVLHGRFGSLEIERVPVAFLHGDDANVFRETVRSGRWQLVCFGHTHQASLERHGPTWLLNPGALYRARPRSLAVVDLPELKFVSVPLST